MVRALGKEVSGTVGATMMLGIVAVLVWRYGLGLSGAMYDVLPGMATGFVVYGVSQKLAPAQPSTSR